MGGLTLLFRKMGVCLLGSGQFAKVEDLGRKL